MTRDLPQEPPPTPAAQPAPDGRPDIGAWMEELTRLDLEIYGAVAGTPTPTLDRVFRWLSRATDHWQLWLGTAAVLASAGGDRGRRAAVNGLTSLTVTSTVVTVVLKPLGGRRRPDRARSGAPASRHVTMPRTTSFPSGHAASASAFATGVASVMPEVGALLNAGAALVAYSRVHTGVHYPVDVIAGSVVGTALGQITVAALDHRRFSAHGRNGRSRSPG